MMKTLEQKKPSLSGKDAIVTDFRGRATLWLVVVEGDIEPRLEGPFRSDRSRIISAREHRRNDPERNDGLFRLDISSSGAPRIRHFRAFEVEPEGLTVLRHVQPKKTDPARSQASARSLTDEQLQ